MTKSFYVISLDVDKRFATEEGNEVTLNASTVDLQRGSLFMPSFIGNFACTGIRGLCVAKITKAQGFCLSINPCVFFNLSGIFALVAAPSVNIAYLRAFSVVSTPKFPMESQRCRLFTKYYTTKVLLPSLLTRTLNPFVSSSRTTNRLFLGLRASTVRCVNLIFTTVTHVLGNIGATEI